MYTKNANINSHVKMTVYISASHDSFAYRTIFSNHNINNQ